MLWSYLHYEQSIFRNVKLTFQRILKVYISAELPYIHHTYPRVLLVNGAQNWQDTTWYACNFLIRRGGGSMWPLICEINIMMIQLNFIHHITQFHLKLWIICWTQKFVSMGQFGQKMAWNSCASLAYRIEKMV